jgi:prepilin-type N-terminal cleavage/methylation domain-containing protein
MKQEITNYAKFQLEKSKNTLKDAELLYENNRLTSAVNRIYYAIFYSVTAIMSLYGLSTSKHSGMLSNFNKEIANRGLISRELKDFYYDMFNKRQKGDYEIYQFNEADVKQWTAKAKDFINKIEDLTLKIIKEEKEPANKNDLFKNNKGFTLLELVMTIILIGIMSVGLYQVIIFGINNYMLNENALHQVNSMSYTSSVIRRNLEEAVTPPTSPYTITGGVCLLNPGSGSGGNPPPITLACSDGSAPTTGNTPICTSCSNGLSSCPPSEIAFYKYISGTANQELVVFCVNNNVLYKQVTTINGTTTAYPIADNISNIAF